MRKSGVRIAVILAMIVGLSSMAYAEGTKVTVGIKAWSNSWEEEVEYNGGGSDTWDNGSSLMIGPSVNLRFENNMFLGASYLVSTKDYESNDWVVIGDSVSFEREDLDLTVGYMINPRFGVFVGYKSIEFDATYHLPALGIDEKIGTVSLKGPGIGILGNIPLSESLALYGNLAIMSLDQKISTDIGSASSDMTGASFEIGVAFAFSESFSANVGIKSQSFSGDDEFGDTYTETFAGLTFGANYTF